MSVFLYNISILLYRSGIAIAALFNAKARLWIRGRQHIFQKLQDRLSGGQPVIWVHCASLGEFEQGRPVIEAIKKERPEQKILLTFFSPSGYEVRKNYSGADYIYYLPLDTKQNAERFIQIVNPSLAIFVKYEYWYHYLDVLKARQVHTIIISAIFRPSGIFFKWYGGLHRQMLHCFNHIFVQNEASKQLIAGMYPGENITVAGDTRFDRVAAIANDFTPIAAIDQFVKDKEHVIVAGSTWPKDEEHIKSVLDKTGPATGMIIAPHEIHESHLELVQRLFPDNMLYGSFNDMMRQNEPLPSPRVLIIDNFGMLSKLYHYATICYVGGGFNSGIHNTLEAAVHGKPVIFGPKYEKFAEAVSLIKIRGGFSYNTDNELKDIVDILLNNRSELERSAKAAGDYVHHHTGATPVIMRYVNLLLTSSSN